MTAVATEQEGELGPRSAIAAISFAERDPAAGPRSETPRRPASEQLPAERPQVREVLNFDDFYANHRDEIGRALAFTLGSRTLGQEAVDEAMARAYQRWDRVGSFDRPAGWVYRTGLNWGRSSLRSMLRRRRREQLVAESDQQILGSLNEARTELVAALGELSIGHRAVVVLRYYCDWSVADTAAALDIAEGTVQSRSARALDQLRRVLGDADGPGGRSA